MSQNSIAQQYADLSPNIFQKVSKYDFQTSNNQFQQDQKVINDSVTQINVSQQQIFDTPQVNKKLYLKDLQTQNQKAQSNKGKGKQNNISNQIQQQSSQSRKITIHKNFSINPYIYGCADESFSTTKIVQLQQQLINLRKEMSLKQSSWIKQKSILLNKIEISNFDLAEMKQRNNNLIQINQTLTQALGQTHKNVNSYEKDKQIQQITRQLNQKICKIQSLQDKLSRNQRQRNDNNLKINEEKEKCDYLTKNLEQYKTIVKQSNQRKLESDQKFILLIKNIQTLKQKIKSLPIKDEYLNPIYSFLNSMKENENQIAVFSEKQQYQQYYDSSQKKQVNQKKQVHFFKAQKKYKDNRQFLQVQPKQQNYIRDEQFYKNDFFSDEHSYIGRQSQIGYDNQTAKMFKKQQRKSNFNGNNYKKRIETEENEFQVNQNNYDDIQQQQQVYLCEICQRIYPHQNFLNHMADCKQYEALIRQKKLIQSKLISIKEQEYDNRKSNMSSLNSSAIILNKSRSKGKLTNPSKNMSNGNRLSNQPKHYGGPYNGGNTRGKENGNRTERYMNRQQSHQSSRLQLSQLLDISGISNRQSNMIHYNRAQKDNKKREMHSNNYFTSNNQIINDNNFYSNYQSKPYPQIKYQTNMAMQANNIGKESMQEEIRKIVETLNQGGRSGNRSQINMKKQVVKAPSNSRNPSMTNRNNNEKAQKENRIQKSQNFKGHTGNKMNRNKAEFY